VRGKLSAVPSPSHQGPPLRVLSYLAPSIPEGYFQLVAEHLRGRTGVAVALDFETSVSGPTPETDPFASGRADIAFVCGPSYAELKAAGSAVEILPAAPVPDDPRAEGRAVYFSDVIVRRGSAATRFEDLRGSVWAYNDQVSLSGWYAMLARLAEVSPGEQPASFFRGLSHSGSHLRSIELVASGEADAAAIDSNALRLALRHGLALESRLRVIESWGPRPIQPLLARAGIPADLKARILATLLSMHEGGAARRSLETFGVLRFTRVEESDYAMLQVPRT
jgi:phosphonate transport system substrate-binding protein